MNVDKIRKQLKSFVPEQFFSKFEFYSDDVIENHSELFWKFIQAGFYDSYKEIPSEFGVTKEIFDASQKIHNNLWLLWIAPQYDDDNDHNYHDEINDLECYFASDGDIAVQISFVMEVFKFGNISDSVEFFIHGLKDLKNDKKIFAGILTVNSETMSYKELQ